MKFVYYVMVKMINEDNIHNARVSSTQIGQSDNLNIIIYQLS